MTITEVFDRLGVPYLSSGHYNQAQVSRFTISLIAPADPLGNRRCNFA